MLELKNVLSYILNIDNISLRRKALEFAMELLTEVEMDFTKAEQALKAEIAGDQKEANKWIERILLDIDKTEYSSEE